MTRRTKVVNVVTNVRFFIHGKRSPRAHLELHQHSGTIGTISGSNASSQPQRPNVFGHGSKQHVVGRRWYEKGSLAVGQKVVQNSRNVLGVASVSTVNPDEREFIVDSGGSMHMMSNMKLLLEMDTVKVSRLSTTATTANGSVDTNEEAKVYANNFDLSVTVQLFEDTTAVGTLRRKWAVI